jgi:hypothetical protein
MLGANLLAGVSGISPIGEIADGDLTLEFAFYIEIC